MTDVELLKERIDASGLTIVWIATQMGLSREGLYRKLRGESEFKASEIVQLSNLLHLDEVERGKIFLHDS